jgi:hypothetical protein
MSMAQILGSSNPSFLELQVFPSFPEGPFPKPYSINSHGGGIFLDPRIHVVLGVLEESN